jgi:hypothetical protein
VHNANNQLCGATYVEMHMAGLGGATLDDTKKVFGEGSSGPAFPITRP